MTGFAPLLDRSNFNHQLEIPQVISQLMTISSQEFPFFFYLYCNLL